MLDLWPNDIGVGEEMVSPVSVLKEQAALLSQKTEDKVHGLVESYVYCAGGSFYKGAREKMAFNFCLTVPLLDMKFKIFTIIHELAMYPVTFEFERTCLKIQTGGSGTMKACDMREFVCYLRKIFESEIMKQNIRGLMSQVEPS